MQSDDIFSRLVASQLLINMKKKVVSLSADNINIFNLVYKETEVLADENDLKLGKTKFITTLFLASVADDLDRIESKKEDKTENEKNSYTINIPECKQNARDAFGLVYDALQRIF